MTDGNRNNRSSKMDASAQHAYTPDVSFDGGDLDCGNGLLLLIRKHIDPLLSLIHI